MERGPRRRTLAERMEEEFGVNLEDQLRALRESDKVESIDFLLQKLETFLVEAGVELTQPQKQQLRDLLKAYGRESGLSYEE